MLPDRLAHTATLVRHCPVAYPAMTATTPPAMTVRPMKTMMLLRKKFATAISTDPRLYIFTSTDCLDMPDFVAGPLLSSRQTKAARPNQGTSGDDVRRAVCLSLGRYRILDVDLPVEQRRCIDRQGVVALGVLEPKMTRPKSTRRSLVLRRLG